MLTHDMQLLYSILNTQSYSYQTGEMEKTIIDILNKDYKEVEVERDAYGNIYIKKGKGPYPLICAHIDTVHKIRSKYQVNEIDGIIWATAGKKDAGIGGDDKCGIYACLYLLKRVKNIKCVLYKDEEVGRIGAKNSNFEYYKDCLYAIEIDRRGKSDFITHMSGIRVCSNEFINDIKPLMEKYEYKETYGSFTDVLELIRKDVGISVCNISCGYYNPHTFKELIVLDDLGRAIELTYDIINTIKKKYEYKYVEPVYINKYHGYTGGYRDRIKSFNTKNYGLGYEKLAYDYDKERYKLIQLGGSRLFDIADKSNRVEFSTMCCEKCKKSRLEYSLTMDRAFCCACGGLCSRETTEVIKTYLSVNVGGMKYNYIKDIDKFVDITKLRWNIKERKWYNVELYKDFIDKEGKVYDYLAECQIDDALTI